MSRLEPFVLLADVSTYRACEWDFTEQAEARGYWVPLFVRNFEITMRMAREVELSRGRGESDVIRRVEACRAALREQMERYMADPAAFGPVSILTLDRWRDRILRAHGLVDPYELMKRRENERVLPLLGPLCAQLAASPPGELALALIEGVFAGNIFDMGAEATAKQFAEAPPDFFAVRRRLARRPWLVDDFDLLAPRLTAHLAQGGVIRKLVFFVDNAGPDFVLGAIPLVWALARRGAEVVVVANERPTLNDMTIADVNAWWPRLVDVLPELAELPVVRVSSGTGEPLIDLGEVSVELNRAAVGADLVLLEGMGRGVESNLEARLTCDRLNLAMIKDPFIAARHGGKLYDCVCRYEPAGRNEPAGDLGH